MVRQRREMEGCACCGVILGPTGTSGFPVCKPCAAHVLPRPGGCQPGGDEDRTYLGQHGVDCPYVKEVKDA